MGSCFVKERKPLFTLTLTGVREQIGDLDREAPIELCKGYRTPGCLWEWLLGKGDVLVDDGKGLTDGDLIKAFRASNILGTYQFENEIIRRTMTMYIAERMGCEEQDVESRENFPAYLRPIGRKLQNEFNENNTRWGNADTYDHTRRIPHRWKYGCEWGRK